MMTAQCLENFELLSALLDGETTPAESLELRAHLENCRECRSAYEAMAGLGDRVVTAGPAPRRLDMAQRVAGYVRSQMGTPPRPPRLGLWKNLRELKDHPLRKLMDPARRRRLAIGPKEFLKVFAMFAIPTLVLCGLRDYAPLMAFLGVAGLGVLLGIPARHLATEVALLSSLRRGRGLEEILGSGLSAQGVVDCLATQGLGALLKLCVPLAALLGLGSLALPVQFRSLATFAAECWLPAVLLVFLTGSYLCQFALAWQGARTRQFAWMAAVMGPALTVFALLDDAHPVLGCLLAAGWMILLSRKLAIVALENPDKASPRSAGRLTRNPWLSTFSDNPITRRELARVSGSVVQGVKGVILWRLSMTAVPLLWAVWASGQGDHWARTFWSGVALFSALIFARSAYRSLPSILHEREQGTWESLMQTRMGLATFVRGWMEVSLYTTFVDSIAMIFVLLSFGLMAPQWLVESGSQADGLRLAGACGLGLALVSLLGSLVGLAISATTRTTREAGSRLLAISFNGFLIWLGLYAVCAALLQGFSLHSTATKMLWLDASEKDSGLLAALLVGVAGWLWSRRILRYNFLAADIVASSRSSKKRYPATNLPLDLAAPGFLVYGGSLAWFLLSGMMAQANFEPQQFAAVVILWIGVWFALIRLPLASLSELAMGTSKSMLLGTLNGFLLGCSASLLLRSLAFLNHKNVFTVRIFWLDEIEFTSRLDLAILAGGLTIGVIAGIRSARSETADSDRRQSLRLRAALSGSLSVALFSLSGFWLHRAFDRSLDRPEDTMRALAAAQAKIQAYRQLQTHKRDNGFEVLRSLVMRPKDRLPWHQHSHSYDGGATSAVRAALSDAEGRRFETEFLNFVPTLDAALARPQFAAPYDLDISRRLPNYLVYRTIAQALAEMGALRESRANFEQALAFYRRGLQWAQRNFNQGNLIDEMIAGSLQAIVNTRYLYLESTQILTASQYREIIRDVESNAINPQWLGDSLERELAMGWEAIHRHYLDDSKTNELTVLPVPDAYLRYEQVALANLYARAIPRVRRFELGELSRELLESEESDYPLAIYAHSTLVNFQRATYNMARVLSRREAVRVIAALKLYRIEHGTWPGTLNELVGPYLKGMPVCYASNDRQFTYSIRAGQAELSCPNVLVRRGGDSVDHLYPFREIP